MRRTRLSLILPGVLTLAALVFLSAVESFAQTQVQISEGASVRRIPYDPPNERQIKFELTYHEATSIPGSGGKDLFRGVTIKQFPLGGGNPQWIAETPECIAETKFKEASSTARLQVQAQDGRFFIEGVGFLLQATNSLLRVSNEVHSIIRSATNTLAPGTDITAHSAEFRARNATTNGTAVYQGRVRVVDPKMKLDCEWLLAELPADITNQYTRPNHIVAETNVAIDFSSPDGGHTYATGQKAVYEYHTVAAVTNESLELTGEPKVELTNGWLTADKLVMDRATAKLEGWGHVHLHYQAEGQSQKETDTEVLADRVEFDFDSRLAHFWNHVQASQGQMTMNSEMLTAHLPKEEVARTNRLDRIIAETNVVMDFVDKKTGQKIHATGDKADYRFNVSEGTTNEVMDLTGNPVVETTGTNSSAWMTADIVTVDRAQGKIRGIGNQHSVRKKQPGDSASMDTEVFSERLDFDTATGLSVYEGNVRAYDPAMNLTSRTLTLTPAKRQPGQTNHLESIEADGDVVIDFVEKAFAAKDLGKLPELAARLKQPAPDDLTAQYVSSQLSPETRQLLMNYNGGKAAELQTALAADLNRLTQGGAIYDPKRFAKVYLSLETSALLHQQPLGVDLVSLNRLLLLDAFRGELSRTQGGEKTHATADHAKYTTTPDEILALAGHPKLDKPGHWTATATKAIIYNRTTGESHSDGESHVHITLDTLNQNKPLGDGKKAKP